MLALEILSHDHAKNHQDSDHFLQSLEEILTKVTEGYRVNKYDKVLIIHRATGAQGEGCEFHCYNAGTAQELAQTVLAFMQELREQGYHWAATPYQNPRITELFKQHIASDHLTITGIPEGILATVRL